MKAKIVIPKGWRRLRYNDLIKKGDRILETEESAEWTWNLVVRWEIGGGVWSKTVIRKVKK